LAAGRGARRGAGRRRPPRSRRCAARRSAACDDVAASGFFASGFGSVRVSVEGFLRPRPPRLPRWRRGCCAPACAGALLSTGLVEASARGAETSFFSGTRSLLRLNQRGKGNLLFRMSARERHPGGGRAGRAARTNGNCHLDQRLPGPGAAPVEPTSRDHSFWRYLRDSANCGAGPGNVVREQT
jgi:hypothetical protein